MRSPSSKRKKEAECFELIRSKRPLDSFYIKLGQRAQQGQRGDPETEQHNITCDVNLHIKHTAAKYYSVTQKHSSCISYPAHPHMLTSSEGVA